MITVVDQNGSKFGESTVEKAIERCNDYAKIGDRFRIYVVNKENSYPGYIAAEVSCDKEGIWEIRN